MLFGRLSGQVGEPGNANDTRKPTINGCFDKIRRKDKREGT